MFLTQKRRGEEQLDSATVKMKSAWPEVYLSDQKCVFISHVIIATLFKVQSVCIQHISKFLSYTAFYDSDKMNRSLSLTLTLVGRAGTLTGARTDDWL